MSVVQICAWKHENSKFTFHWLLFMACTACKVFSYFFCHFVFRTDFFKCFKELTLKRQKWRFANVLQNMCSLKFCNIHKKRPALESLFNEVEGLWPCKLIKKRLQHRCFPANIAKFLKAAFLQDTFGGCFWKGLLQPLLKHPLLIAVKFFIVL